LKNVCPERLPIEKLKLKLPTKSHIVIRLLEPLLIANYSRLIFRQAPLPPNPLFKQHLRWAFLHLTPTYFSKLHFCCSSNINKNAKE
jgi:hypothetical protein